MKGLLSFTILALVAFQCACTASLAREDLPDCSPGQPEHQPHPTDCTKYYTCSNGEAILQECPPGLWWSTLLDTCDLPENTQCVPGGSTSTEGTTETTTMATESTSPPTETPSTTAETSTIPPSTTPSEVSTEPPGGFPNECPSVDEPGVVIRLPHETSCSFYYKCEKGVPILFTCQTGDQFSPTKRVCRSNDTAGCDSCPVVDEAGDIARLPHETLCHFYYLCHEGEPLLYQCRKEWEFSRSVRDCLEPSDANCTLGHIFY